MTNFLSGEGWGRAEGQRELQRQRLQCRAEEDDLRKRCVPPGIQFGQEHNHTSAVDGVVWQSSSDSLAVGISLFSNKDSVLMYISLFANEKLTQVESMRTSYKPMFRNNAIFFPFTW